MKIESSYVVAAILAVKNKYFNESFVKSSELYAVTSSTQSILNNLESRPVIVASCSSDYFRYSENCGVIFPIKDLSEITFRYQGYLPMDVLNIIWNENFIIEALFVNKREEIEMAQDKIKNSRSK